MPNTYTLIEKITVGAAGAASVTFTSIPQTYTDLKVVLSARNVTTYGNAYYDAYIKLNTTAGTSQVLYGNGSTVTAGVDASNSPIYGITSSGATASTFGNAEVYIPNYTGSTNKSISVDSVSENNATAAIAQISANLHTLASAVTSITITPYDSPTGSFAQYSTFYLYGIAKEGVNPATSSAPYATGGDSIVFDGTYWIHTFTSSGTFTPKKGLTCDYLVVAGGGPGGATSTSSASGGGGAGGLRSTVTATGGGGSLESALSLTKDTGYTITIGAGGSSGSNGNDSSISGTGITTVTSTGGGRGGVQGNSTNGFTGGSGGGAGGNTGSGSINLGGSGTANQGYKGGDNGSTLWGNGAGGGGAGAAAANISVSSSPTNGGNGVATSISGSSVTYAGGGGGGRENTNAGASGGTGGGGTGGNNGTAPTSGTANTGGGGGGKGGSTAGVGSGGSGIVIVRYAA